MSESSCCATGEKQQGTRLYEASNWLLSSRRETRRRGEEGGRAGTRTRARELTRRPEGRARDVECWLLGER